MGKVAVSNGQSRCTMHKMVVLVFSSINCMITTTYTKLNVRWSNLKVSEVFHTGGGGLLSCQYIVHAVGPMWCLYPDKVECGQTLMRTIVNCLNYANQILHARSIALPAISTGKS